MTRPSIANGLALRGLRGATTCGDNSVEAIEVAVHELVTCLVERNALEADRIVSVTFSVTTDLDACFPAAIARRQQGWDEVALLDCQQMAVQGDLKRCIYCRRLCGLHGVDCKSVGGYSATGALDLETVET